MVCLLDKPRPLFQNSLMEIPLRYAPRRNFYRRLPLFLPPGQSFALNPSRTCSALLRANYLTSCVRLASCIMPYVNLLSSKCACCATISNRAAVLQLSRLGRRQLHRCRESYFFSISVVHTVSSTSRLKQQPPSLSWGRLGVENVTRLIDEPQQQKRS